MTSNEERREVAKELRKLADSPYSSDDVRSDVRTEDVCYELGLERGFYDNCVDPESVKRLAELIDRPTCHDTNCVRVSNECFACSECGREFNTWDDDRGWYYIHYCPNCGKEVVE